jgi:putative membrane protein
MMWYWSGGMHWWGWLLGTVGMVAFWGLIIWAVWYLVTGGSRRPDLDRRSPDDARRILDERLARGEIESDEYRRLRDLISGDHAGSRAGPPPVGTGVQR